MVCYFVDRHFKFNVTGKNVTSKLISTDFQRLIGKASWLFLRLACWLMLVGQLHLFLYSLACLKGHQRWCLAIVSMCACLISKLYTACIRGAYITLHWDVSHHVCKCSTPFFPSSWLTCVKCQIEKQEHFRYQCLPLQNKILECTSGP